MAVNLIHMKCQNCGANLDIDIDNMMAFCPYCGEKLMIDAEQLCSVLIEREKTKQKEMEFDNKLEYEKLQHNLKMQKEKYDNKNFWIAWVVMMAVLILGFMFLSTITD